MSYPRYAKSRFREAGKGRSSGRMRRKRDVLAGKVTKKAKEKERLKSTAVRSQVAEGRIELPEEV